MNIHGLDPVLQWNQPFDLRAATPTGQGYAGILLKSSLSPCSLCQGSFTLSIGGQDLGQAPAGQCTWYIMRQPSAEQDGSTSILKIENLSQSRIISARDFLWQLPKATRLGSSIRGQGCLRLLRNGQRRAIPCKQVLASSLSLPLSLSLSLSRNFNPFEFYPYLLNCSYSPKLSVLHCCTGICHKLLPLAFKRVTSLETKGMKWKSPTSGTTPVIGWIQSAVETFSQFKLFRSV